MFAPWRSQNPVRKTWYPITGKSFIPKNSNLFPDMQMSKDKKPWNIWEYLGMGENTRGNFWEFLGIPSLKETVFGTYRNY